MVSLAESSVGSVPLEELRAAQQRLNQYKQSNHDTHSSTASASPVHKALHAIETPAIPSIGVRRTNGAIVPESIEQQIPDDSLSRARDRLHGASGTALPDMIPAPVEGEWMEMRKVGSSNEGGGDTQPWDSQAVVETSKSMIALGQPISEQPSTAQEATTDTYCSTQGPDIDLGLDEMPSVHPQAIRESQNADVDMLDEGEDAPSPTTSQAEQDLLRDGTQPQTELRAPTSTFPATPSLAGQKHSRNGDILTSATTVARTPGYAEFFQDGVKSTTMTNTQLFRASDSSPFSGPTTDPIKSRPSPNVTDLNRVSSPPTFSSPAQRRQPGHSISITQADPQIRYISMKESQELRKQRQEGEQSSGLGEDAGDLDELDALDDSWDIRMRRSTSRLRPASEHLSRVTAPARSSSRPRSANGAIEIHDTPETVRKASEWNAFVKYAVGEQTAIEEEEDNQQINDTQKLAEEPQVMFSERDEGDADIRGSVRDFEVHDEEEDHDEYDEFGQELRSQGALPPTQDDAAESDADGQHDFEINDADGVNGASPQVDRREVHRMKHEFTVANSQITGQSMDHPSASRQAIQYSSYVPGSQHQGRTSQEMALLRTSGASDQCRIAASQLSHEPSNEISASGYGVPSSPPNIARRESTADFTGLASAGHELPTQAQESGVDENTGGTGLDSAANKSLAQDAAQYRHAEALDDGVPPYSTARTHVSGSGLSPVKHSAVVISPTPAQSQRSRLTDQSPAIQRFADFARSGPPVDHSMGTEYSQTDVEAYANQIYTAEDQQVHQLMSDDRIETPKTKRVKRTHYISANATPKRQNGHRGQEGNACDADQQSDIDEVADTVRQSDTTTKRIGLGEHQRNETTPASTDHVLRHTSGHRHDSPPVALRDSPNKANWTQNNLANVEHNDSGESATESVRLREAAGRAAVSQLVSLRTSTKEKKSRQKTYARESRRKSRVHGAAAKVKAGAPAPPNDNYEERYATTTDERPVTRPASEHELPSSSARPATEQASSQSRAATSTTSVDITIAGPGLGEQPAESDYIADSRVFVLFKGTPQNVYPATWLGANPDGTKCKIKFDDGTVTNIETYHVRRLELRTSDVVRVDHEKMRKKTWVVKGFGPIATTHEERASGTDVFGHTHVTVQSKGHRESSSKSALTDVADALHTVPISLLYLTTTMWPHFKDRAFDPPVYAAASRPETPISGHASASSTSGTPTSRPRHAPAPSVKVKVARKSHLCETSVASSANVGSGKMFAGMAFAISYLAPDAEKREVANLIQQNGGTILEDGFEQLFELPDIGASSTVSPSTKSIRKVQSLGQGLRLNDDYKDLKFAALIADRHSRRAKYMQALALGLPTISGRWILHSLAEARDSVRERNSPLPWNRYLLPAGESTFLNAIRSRNLTPYDAASASLTRTIANRARLLDNEGMILVAQKTGSANREKRKTFAFLTMACGAGQVRRVNDLAEARALTLKQPETWKWVYVDSSMAEAEKVIFGRAASSSNKRKQKKRGSETANSIGGNTMSATNGAVKIVNDEFVIQSLILEALVE